MRRPGWDAPEYSATMALTALAGSLWPRAFPMYPRTVRRAASEPVCATQGVQPKGYNASPKISPISAVRF